jgi:hypothetical protein
METKKRGFKIILVSFHQTKMCGRIIRIIITRNAIAKQ